MAFVFYRHPRHPNEVSVTIAGRGSAIAMVVERLEREGNEVTSIIPPPANHIIRGSIPPKRALI
jgi:hypothetical protein